MPCDSGHRLEFYGENGTLLLNNSSDDYMRDFELLHGERPAAALARIPVADPTDVRCPDGRIASVSRLAKSFLDAMEKGESAQPDFAAGFRVQQLIDAAQRSHHDGEMITVSPARMEAGTCKILVTGRSGFIGSALAKALVRAGHIVRVLDDNSRGRPRRLREVEKEIEFIAGGHPRCSDGSSAQPKV